MNRGFLYLIIALPCGVFAFYSPMVLTIFLIWLAVASFYFAMAYFLGYGEILLKSSSGRIPWYIKIVLLPIFIGTTVYNLIARMNDPAPPLQKIQDGLWLSRRLVFSDRLAFENSGITAVLDVTAEFDAFESNFLPRNINYFNIPVMRL
jgi:hypothetical protein